MCWMSIAKSSRDNIGILACQPISVRDPPAPQVNALPENIQHAGRVKDRILNIIFLETLQILEIAATKLVSQTPILANSRRFG
ncbi:hypothetical protein AJ80_08750 [Polytolypa hystricis UAMH7299]|uniref:Uncharacterized protein n=1 Tax=Polytolypa hystricis (strain UAMH7299) TaxID=1447883 RepID=A0A2B7X2A5_POLH7|nr:hypothetical protein AJ80_08750 [Polytolypa hystricis UAMH7299]